MPAVLAQRIIREVAAASADPPTKRELVTSASALNK